MDRQKRDPLEASQELREETAQLTDAAKVSGLQFVRTELELALTFLSVATRRGEDPKQHSTTIENAKKAYAGALGGLAKLTPTEDERAAIDKLRADVERELERLGEQI